MDLTQRHCVPCEGGVPRLGTREVEALLPDVPGWTVEGERLRRSYRHADFVAAMRFVNALAELAEQEGHHPDFCVHWDRVDVSIWTHAAGGLTENDFVLAAKLDALRR